MSAKKFYDSVINMSLAKSVSTGVWGCDLHLKFVFCVKWETINSLIYPLTIWCFIIVRDWASVHVACVPVDGGATPRCKRFVEKEEDRGERANPWTGPLMWVRRIRCNFIKPYHLLSAPEKASDRVTDPRDKVYVQYYYLRV